MKRTLIILFFLLNSTSTFSQCIPSDSIYLDSLVTLYSETLDFEKVDLALNQLNSLEQEANEKSCFVQVVYTKLIRTQVYNNSNQIFNSYKELLDIEALYFKHSKLLHTKDIPFLINYSWGRYNVLLGNNKEAEKRYKKALNVLNLIEEKNPEKAYYKSILLGQIGLLLSYMGRTEESIQYQHQSLNLTDDPLEMSSGLKFIGIAYTRLNNFDSAEKYYQKSYNLLNNLFENKPELKLTKKNHMISLLSNFAKLYKRKAKEENNVEDLDLAESYIQKSLPYHSNLTDDTELQYTYKIYGDIKLDMKQFSEAENYYKKVKKITESNSRIAKCNIKLAEIYQKQGDFQKALDTLQIATNFLYYPNTELIISDIDAIEAYTLKADIFFNIYQKEGNKNNLQNALEAVNKGALAVNEILTYYETFKDKENLISKSYSLFEFGVRAAYKLQEITENSKYKNQAFSYSEQSKAVVLKDAFKRSYAVEVGIPEIYRQKELIYNKNLSSIKTKITREIDAQGKNIAALADDYLELNEAYSIFKNDTLSTFPKYKSLMNDKSIPDLQSIKKSLGSGRSILEYFIGDDVSYAFILKEGQDIEMIELDLKKDELEDVANSFLECLHNKTPSCFKSWPRESHHLYELIFQPLENKLTEKVTIIPDGVLCYVPFSTLLSSYKVSKSPKTEWESLNYLLKDYIFNYNYSAYTLESKKEKEKTEKDISFLGFAPFDNSSVNFENQYLGNDKSSTLSYLSGSSDLIKSIADLYGQKKAVLFNGEAGTLSEFLKQAPNSKIIHLHTHGILDKKNPDLSYLVFKNDKEETENLELSKLYGLNLNSDIITLPACYSGHGKTQRGQGIISMARAFFYAGSDSVFPSLWRANNRSISTITKSFYENINKGIDKETAMTLAKRDYLDNNEGESLFPHYWGSYIAISKIPAAKPFNFLYWGGVLLGGLMLLFFLIRKKKNQSNKPKNSSASF